MPPRSTPARSRDQILDAADRLLVRYGYSKMTVSDLAREAGIGKGTVYLSFRSKGEVALACIDRMAARIADGLRALAEGHGTPASRLRAMMTRRVLDRFDYARGHSHSLDGILAALRPALLARRAAHFEAEAALLASVLREGLATGTFARGDAATARSLVLATNALLPYSLSVRELGERRALEKDLDRLVDLLIAGLGPRPAPAMEGPSRPVTRRRPR